MLMGRALNGISIIGDEYLLCPVDYTHTHPRKNNLLSVQNWEVMMKGGGYRGVASESIECFIED